jgi:phenylalanyl-tRNA synthetase alpha chain
MYKLTKEGLEYLKNGLPEKTLLSFLEKGKKSLADVTKLPNSTIAIGWARKNGWIKVIENHVELTDEGWKALREKTDVEEALEDIRKGGEAEDLLIKILSSRKLIEESIKKPRKGIIEKIKSLFKRQKKKEEISNEIAQLTPELIKNEKWKEMQFRKYDVNAPAPKIYGGKKQPYMQFIEDIRERLTSLGFKEMKGPLIETFFWNCDALFMPQDHPGRGIHDVLLLKHPAVGHLPDENLVSKIKATHEGGWITGSTGWGGIWNREEAAKLLMRSQTTPVSARTLVKHGDKPGKYFTIHKIYRHDIVDYKHLVEFDQCEGIVIGEKLTFRHLLGFLKEFADMLGVEKFRFKPSYFPFTEPSVELFLEFPKTGWVEVGGAGMFRPEVLRPLGIENSQVLAWGLGINRLAMIKLGIDDIRQLYSEDLGFLREKPMVI